MNVQGDMSLRLFRPLSTSERQRGEDPEMASNGFSGSDWMVTHSTETLSAHQFFAKRQDHVVSW